MPADRRATLFKKQLHFLICCWCQRYEEHSFAISARPVASFRCMPTKHQGAIFRPVTKERIKQSLPFKFGKAKYNQSMRIPAARDRLSRLQVSWPCCDESGEIQVSEPATADIRKKLPVSVTVRDGQLRNGDGFAGTDVKYATLGVTTAYQRPTFNAASSALFTRPWPCHSKRSRLPAVALCSREESLTFLTTDYADFCLNFPRRMSGVTSNSHSPDHRGSSNRKS